MELTICVLFLYKQDIFAKSTAENDFLMASDGTDYSH
jgi:hypothetical protein